MKKIIKEIAEYEKKSCDLSKETVCEVVRILGYIIANDQEKFMVFRHYVAARRKKVDLLKYVSLSERVKLKVERQLSQE